MNCFIKAKRGSINANSIVRTEWIGGGEQRLHLTDGSTVDVDPTFDDQFVGYLPAPAGWWCLVSDDDDKLKLHKEPIVMWGLHPDGHHVPCTPGYPEGVYARSYAVQPPGTELLFVPGHSGGRTLADYSLLLKEELGVA